MLDDTAEIISIIFDQVEFLAWAMTCQHAENGIFFQEYISKNALPHVYIDGNVYIFTAGKRKSIPANKLIEVNFLAMKGKLLAGYRSEDGISITIPIDDLNLHMEAIDEIELVMSPEVIHDPWDISRL